MLQTIPKDFFDFLIEPIVFIRIKGVKINCVPVPVAPVADIDSTVFRVSNPFPEDLRVWLNAPALLRVAQGIAQANSVETLRPVFSFRATRFHHPWRMLALHTYAYGSSLWDARAIAKAAACDADLRELCRNDAPSADMVRRFRNHNRTAVLRCVEELLRHAWCHRHDQRTTAAHPLLTVEILCEARARLHRAERCDVAGEPCRVLN